MKSLRFAAALCLAASVLAAAMGGQGRAQFLDSLVPACRFSGVALKGLRTLRETAPSQSADLLKAISVFPCDTQNRSLERVGSKRDSGEIYGIFAQTLERGTKRETACIMVMRIGTWRVGIAHRGSGNQVAGQLP